MSDLVDVDPPIRKRQTPSHVKFEYTVEVVNDVPTKFRWSESHVESKGWSGCAVLSKNTHFAVFEQVTPPTKFSNEIHVFWSPGKWRDTQVLGFLDDGSVYGAYGQRLKVAKAPWRECGATVSVSLKVDAKNNKAKLSLYAGDVLVHKMKIKGDDNKNVADLLIEARVHPGGTLRLV
jgi:hypothetical protein